MRRLWRPGEGDERRGGRWSLLAGVLARHLLRMFATRCAWLFVVGHLFLALVAVLALSFEHPFIPFLLAAGELPDLLLLGLPVTVPLTMVVGAFGCLCDPASRQARLAVELAGRDPRAVLGLVLGAAAVVSAAMWWLNSCVLPQVLYQARFELERLERDSRGVVIELARDSGFLDAIAVDFESADGETLAGPRILHKGSAATTAVVGRLATVGLAADRSTLGLSVEDGRLLQVDREGRPGTNLRFDRLRLELDAVVLGRRTKQDVVDAKYYTDRELDRLPELLALRRRSGLLPGASEARRLASVAAVRATRWQSSLLPFLLVLMCVATLGGPGRHEVGGRRLAAIGVLAVAVLVQQMLLEERARRVSGLPPAVAFLPAAEVAAVVAVAVLRGALVRRRWRRCG